MTPPPRGTSGCGVAREMGGRMKREVRRPAAVILASAAIMIGAATSLAVLMPGSARADHLLASDSSGAWRVLPEEDG